MRKGKRFLAWFLSAALTITSVNIGTAVSVNAKEVVSKTYYQEVTGEFKGTDGNQVTLTGTQSKQSVEGTDVQAPFIEGETVKSGAGASACGTYRYGCLVYDIPSEMDITNLNKVTVSLYVNDVSNSNSGSGQWMKVALYETTNPDKESITASDVSTYPFATDEYGAYKMYWSDEKAGYGDSEAVLKDYIHFDVTEAFETAYNAGKNNLVLRVMIPRAGINFGDAATYPTTLTIDATTETSFVVNYVDEEGNPLKDAKENSVYVGSQYTYEVSEDEKTIVKDGQSYEYNEEKSSLIIDEVSVSGNEVNIVTLVYDKVTLESANEEVSVVTREGIAPILPAKVNALYSSGSVIAVNVDWDEITEEQYASAGTFTVNGKFAGTDVSVTATVTVKSVSEYLMASYSFDEESGATEFADSTSNKAAATPVDKVTTIEGVSGNAVSIPGGGMNAGSIKLPEDLLVVDGNVQDDFTVSMFLKRSANTAGKNSFAMLLHADVTYESWNTAKRKNHISLFNVNGGQDTGLWVEYNNKNASDYKVKGTNPTPTDEWVHVAIVTKGSTNESWLYINGVQDGYSNEVDVNASDLAGRLNYLGKTTWTDVDFAGAYDEFSVYNTALTADEVQAICDPILYEAQIAKTKEALEIGLADTSLEFDASNVTTNLALPKTGDEVGAGIGTTIEWASNNAAVTSTGVVVQPSKNQEDAVVTLTATIKAGSYSDTKEFVVTVPAMEGTNFIGLETAVSEVSANYQAAVKAKIYTTDSLKVWKDAISKAEEVLATKGTETEAEADEVTAATDLLNTTIANNALVVADLDEVNEKALAVWYPLTSDATDASGNGVDGNATGVTFDRSTGATFNGGKNFTSCIQIPTDELDSYVESSMTFSFWAYDNATSGANNTFGIGTKGGNNGGSSKHFYIATGAGNGLNAFVSNNGWNGGAHKGFSGTAFTNKEWHLITAVLDGKNITLYIDGESKGTAETDITIEGAWDADATVRHAMIGNCAYGYNGDANFTGSIKDFRIYNAALTESHVKEIYDYMGTLPMTYAKDDVLAGVKTALGAENVVIAQDGTVTLNITENVTLPITGPQGETIAWASANEAITVDNETGEVTVEVPAADEEKTGTLTATITLGEENDTVIFATRVFYKNNTDVTALQTAVANAEAKGYVAANYTNDSWTAYATALAEAKQYIAQPPATADEVTAAVEKLTNAEAALVKLADMTALKAAIKEADAKISTEYTATSWAKVKAAKDAAELVAANAETPQAEVDKAEAALTEALAALVKLGDKTDLIAALTEAKKLVEAEYTTASWAAYEEVLEAATATKDSKDATEEEVENALEALNGAIEALVKLGDKTDLIAALAEAEKLVEAEYTTASWAAYKEVLETATATKDNKNATKEDVENALEALSGAIEALVSVAEQEVTDAKTDLTTTITEATADLVEADYTQASWKALQDAIAEANKTIEKEDVTVEAIKAAKAAVVEAVENLKLQTEADKEAAVEKAKTELATAITTVEAKIAALKEADYTKESWTAVQTALATAKALSAKADATAEELTAAKTALETAVKGLKAAEVVAPTPTEVKVSKIKIANKNVKIAAGKKVKLVAEVSPENANNKALTWTSSNTKYATVNAVTGEVKTSKKGAGKTVVITATANDGSGVKATIKVKIMKHAVKSIKLKAAKTVKAGKKVKIKTTIKTTGKNVNKTLEWTSSNEKYATVKNGTVITKKSAKGKKVTITAKSTDGTNKKAKITIKIK